MKKYKNIYLLVLVIVASLALTGCTKSTDNTLSNVEKKVEIIDSGSDATLETTADKTTADTSDSTDATDNSKEGKTDSTSKTSEDMTDEETASFTAGDTYEGATNEDNIRIIKYSYSVENGQFIYEWTFNSGNPDKTIGSYEAGYDSDSNLVVKFSSITADSIAKDGENLELGGTLPTLVYGRNDLESTYTFEFGSEKEYEFSITDDILTLRVNL